MRNARNCLCLVWLAGLFFYVPGLWAQSAALDTDYDGRNDAQEASDGTDPKDPNSFINARLGYWRFNADNWRGEQGQLPLRVRDAQHGLGLDGQALQVTNLSSASLLIYRDVEESGSANINCRAGSIRFWYRPTWSSKDPLAPPGFGWGSGPGKWVRLIEVGAWTTDSSVGLFAVSIDPTGTKLVLQTQDGKGGSRTNLEARISLTFRQGGEPLWHEIFLNYSVAASTVRIDSVLMGTGAGITLVPPLDIRREGFSVGSSRDGTLPALGLIDELETFNHGLSAVHDYQKFVSLSANVSTSPPEINLSWRFFAVPVNVQRRQVGQPNWTTLATNLLALGYRDTDVSVGQLYEYMVGLKYILAGINAPPRHDRGRVILLVDSTFARSLAAELDQLRQDLVGDGWSVVRHDVPRHDDKIWARNTNNIQRIKKLILADYKVAPKETKAIFIVGHVAVPYSGYGGRDGHSTNNSPVDHQGAWPADGYYGEVDGKWTDTGSGYVNVSLPEQTNLPGDGKFDQDLYPKPPVIAVGRADFSGLPAFFNPPSPFKPKSELELLRQYLRKNHRYRHKTLTLSNPGVVAGTFFNDPYNSLNQETYFNALRLGSRLFGTEPDAVSEGNLFLEKRSSLWGFLAGFGSGAAVVTSAGMHQAADFVDPAKEPKAGFLILDGSYFGDWLMVNNLLRAVLSTPNYGLASMWGRATAWRWESLGAGEPLAVGFLKTLSDTNQFPAGGPRDLALMGDPTLRAQVLAPPSELTREGSGQRVDLRWKPSPESGATYCVYRSDSFAGPFTPISTGPITGTTFTDPSPPTGAKIYQVRAMRLTTSGSGSYTNLSQGIFVRAL